MRNDRASAAAVAAREPRIDLLRSLDLFAGASRSVLERLADAASERSVPAGTTVIRQGEPADALYLLTEGRLAVQVAENGARSPRPDVTAPGYVGEIGLLKGIPRTATVVAATGCTLLRVSAVDFAGALETASASQSLLTLSGERFARNGRVLVNS
jgi:CRP-like cAMP-binding protein